MPIVKVGKGDVTVILPSRLLHALKAFWYEHNNILFLIGRFHTSLLNSITIQLQGLTKRFPYKHTYNNIINMTG